MSGAVPPVRCSLPPALPGPHSPDSPLCPRFSGLFSPCSTQCPGGAGCWPGGILLPAERLPTADAHRQRSLWAPPVPPTTLLQGCSQRYRALQQDGAGGCRALGLLCRHLRAAGCPSVLMLPILLCRTWGLGWPWSRWWACWRPSPLPKLSVWLQWAGGGPVGGWGLRGHRCSHGGCVLSALSCAPLLAASQNDYRIDANQELLAMGKAVGLVGMGGLSPIWSRGGDSGDTDRAVHPQPLSFLTAGTANILGSFFSSYPITGSFGRWVYGGAHPGGAQRPLAEAVCCWQFPRPVPWPPAAHAGSKAGRSHSYFAPHVPQWVGGSRLASSPPSRACPGAVQAAGWAAHGSVFQDSSECADRGLHPHGGTRHRYCLLLRCSWPRRAPVHGGHG